MAAFVENREPLHQRQREEQLARRPQPDGPAERKPEREYRERGATGDAGRPRQVRRAQVRQFSRGWG